MNEEMENPREMAHGNNVGRREAKDRTLRRRAEAPKQVLDAETNRTESK